MGTNPPPLPSPVLKHWLLHALNVVAPVVLLAALVLSGFYWHENRQGRRAWEAFEAEARAKGEILDYRQLVPKPVPDERNLAAAEIFAPLFPKHFKHGPEAESWLQTLISSAKEGGQISHAWRGGKYSSLTKSALTDIAQSDARAREAQATLEQMAKYEAVLQQVEAAAARPETWYPIDWHEGFAMKLPHLNSYLSVASLFSRHALANLRLRRTMEAYLDTCVLLRFVQAAQSDHTLLGHLLACNIASRSLPSFWEGLRSKAWDDAQLQSMEQLIVSLNMVASMAKAFRIERAANVIPTIQASRQHEFIGLFGGSAANEEKWARALRFVPAGWFDSNRAYCSRSLQGHLDACTEQPPKIDPAKVEAVGEQLERDLDGRPNPRMLLAKLVMPALGGVAVKTAAAQAELQLARIAIRLERHFLKHRQYPATLEQLDPPFSEAEWNSLQDPCGEVPPHFEAQAVGYRLYYEGWNLQPDSGEYHWKDKAKWVPDFTKGDWVWPVAEQELDRGTANE